MKRFGISKQILISAIAPALLVATVLSSYYIWEQFNYITESLNKKGILIAKQLSPAAEYAVYSGNIELIRPLVNTIIKNNPVLRVKILDKRNTSILDITAAENKYKNNVSILNFFFDSKKTLVFTENIISKPVNVEDNKSDELARATDSSDHKIGAVIVTLTTQYATLEKISQIENGIIITMLILLLTTLIIVRINDMITQPIKSLTKTVRNIAAGDLDTHIDQTSVGELGILESCINQMRSELKDSQTDLEIQLNVYTDELQQTLEELEIRNAELDITRSKAIYANNAKSEFLANMSHEIRTPLSGIIGFTELLQSTSLSSQQIDYSSTIQKSARNLLEIINDILDLSKIESGKTEITKSEFKVVEIIEDIINLLSPSALEKNIEIFYRIENNIPLIVHSDPFRIHQILTNLIGNAIKFTNKGYVYLQVTHGEIKGAETSIKFTVSDTGIGMSSSDKKKLFKAFTQADTSITRRFGGTGLGLVISRKLTLLMKGDIGFDSTKGEGSTFWFSVPVTPIPNELIETELSGKTIALICNHFIAGQTFKTLFNNTQCKVNLYTINDLEKLSNIEDNHNAIVLFLSRKDINDSKTAELINKLNITKPSLLIASTNSHNELRSLQKNIFDNAVFTSEKIEKIIQKLIMAINKSSSKNSAEAEEQNTKYFTNWSNVNVMVVDDNDVNLRLAEIILHKHNAKVTTARSGSQAINYARMNSYDIIFMDLHMPGIDGYETTVKIREITPGKQPVIIALTANAMPQEEEQVVQSGMNGIIIKPASEAILQKIINQWVLKDSIISSDATTSTTDDQTDNNNPIFSLGLAKEFTSNNEKLALELFNMLKSELGSYKEEISNAIENNNMKELLTQIHKLNGASRCCGTTELKNISSRLEGLLINKVNFNMEKEISELIDAINNVEKYKM